MRPIASSEMFKHMLGRSNPDDDPVNGFYLGAILMASLIGYVVIGRRLWATLFGPCGIPELVPVGLLAVMLPFVADRLGHVYDFTVLFFMTTLLYLIATRRHALYLVFFALSLLNKETTILAAVAFAANSVGRLPRRTFVLMMLAQIIAFILIYGGLRLHYAGNLGSGMDCWVKGQVRWFFALEFPEFLAYLGGILLVAYRWPAKPLMMRRSIWMVGPHVALFVAGAYPGEFRNLYESVPLLSLFVLRNIQEIIVGASPGHARSDDRAREFSSASRIT